MQKVPRCPLGTLIKSVCVTQRCNASPYICESLQGCPCNNAHRFCKTMQWSSVLQLLQNYRKNIPSTINLFIERVQKIYSNIISKINTQLKIFHEFTQQNLYGSQYYKIMHYIEKQDYNKITCNTLGTIITKMTQRIVCKQVSQQGNKNMQKFTINQMKTLDEEIKKLLNDIQSLYKNKYRSIEYQINEINKRSQHSQINKGAQIKRPQSASSISHNYSNSSTNLSRSNVQNQYSASLTNSNIKRTDSINKNMRDNLFGGTVTSKLFIDSSSSPIKQLANKQFIVGLASTKATQFYNPQLQVSSPIKIKSDLCYPKFINSKIISNASILNHFVMAKVKQYKLIYRASQNNYSIQQFYKKMANHTYHHQKQKQKRSYHHQTTTLLLVKTQFGKVIGGLTSLQWKRNNANNEDEQYEEQDESKSSHHYKQDVRGTSAMFSVDLNEKYQLLDPKYGIYCGNKSIGFGKNDLRIVNHCQKYSKNYIGFPNSYNNGLYLPIKRSSLTLSGSHDSTHFKITQWEMFQVILNHKVATSQTKI